jgi:ATP-binding cassette subfamily G (WHITE) protein 2 (SNQ2)
MSLGYADLPRQTTADYLTGCTDPNERKLAEGRTVNDVPSTPEALEAAFKQSEIYNRMIRERDAFQAAADADEKNREVGFGSLPLLLSAFLPRLLHLSHLLPVSSYFSPPSSHVTDALPSLQNFREAVTVDKHKGVGKKSVYTVSFLAQVKALVIRQFQLKAQDKVDLVVSWTTSIVVAIIAGSVYLQMPQTAAGAFTRGGAMYDRSSTLFLLVLTLVVSQLHRPSLQLFPGFQRVRFHSSRLFSRCSLISLAGSRLR